MKTQLRTLCLCSALICPVLADHHSSEASQPALPAQDHSRMAFMTKLQAPFDLLHEKSATHTAEALSDLQEMQNIDKQAALYQAQYYYVLAEIYDATVLPQKALDALSVGFSLIDEQSQPYLFHLLQITHVRALDLLGKQREALPLANASIEWASSFTSYQMEIEALTARGVVYTSLSESLKALEDFQNAYKIAVKYHDKKFVGITASYIALVYDRRHEGNLAMAYYKEAIDLHRQNGLLTDLSISLYGLGRAYRNIGHNTLAKQHLEESVVVARRIKDEQGVAYGLRELAALSVDRGDYDFAQAMLLEALAIFNTAENNYALLSVYQALAEISLETKNFDSAMNHLARAKSFMLEGSMREENIQLMTLEARVLMGQGRYQASSTLFLEVLESADALARENTDEVMFKLQTEFDMEKKETENTILETENRLQKLSIEAEKRRNSFFFYITLSAAGICLLLVLLMSRSLKHQRQLEVLAGHDTLTGLLNRRRIMEMLTLHLSLAQRHKQPMCVAMFDLDYFKRINDQLGHGTGDKVLKMFGQLCRDSLRKTDQFGRIGGEEFILVLPQTSLNNACCLLERIRIKTESISEILSLTEHKVSVSIGVKEYSEDESSDDILARVDQALYRAKKNGRNQIAVYED